MQRRQVHDVRVVDVAALVAHDGAELLVRVVIDEGRMHEDERLLLGPEGPRVHLRMIDDVDLLQIDAELLRALLHEALDAGELPLRDADGVAERPRQTCFHSRIVLATASWMGRADSTAARVWRSSTNE